jgi:hypothetical protein
MIIQNPSTGTVDLQKDNATVMEAFIVGVMCDLTTLGNELISQTKICCKTFPFIIPSVIRGKIYFVFLGELWHHYGSRILWYPAMSLSYVIAMPQNQARFK